MSLIEVVDSYSHRSKNCGREVRRVYGSRQKIGLTERSDLYREEEATVENSDSMVVERNLDTVTGRLIKRVQV